MIPKKSKDEEKPSSKNSKFINVDRLRTSEKRDRKSNESNKMPNLMELSANFSPMRRRSSSQHKQRKNSSEV